MESNAKRPFAEWIREDDRCLLVKIREVRLIEAEADGSGVNAGGVVAILPDRVKVELSRRQSQWFKERMQF